MASYGHTFTSGDTVTPTKLNDGRTVSDIVNADIAAAAEIAGTKIAPNFGAQNVVTTGSASFGTTASESGYRMTVGGNIFAVGSTGTSCKSTVDMVDQRTIVGAYFEAGVGQHGFVASTNNAETGNSNLLFLTGTTERMRIDASGNVGIGTSSPTFRFVSANNNTDGVWAYSSSFNSIVGLGGYASAGDAAFTLLYDRSAGNFAIRGGSRDTPVERLRIDASGNVGIGTTSPAVKLDVAGDINTSLAYGVDGVQVVGNQRTGWSAPTGTATRTTFATTTVTTAQLAERVKALIDDLALHGLIGN